jgi:hypothetical protein
MPTVVDFEYVGNTPGSMSDFVKKHNKFQLNYELNLRGYKQISSFKGDKPWLMPATKSFRASEVLKEAVDKASGSHYNSGKNKFTDKFEESNANNILHTLEKSTTVYRNAEWQASLRGDRLERKLKLKEA